MYNYNCQLQLNRAGGQNGASSLSKKKENIKIQRTFLPRVELCFSNWRVHRTHLGIWPQGIFSISTSVLRTSPQVTPWTTLEQQEVENIFSVPMCFLKGLILRIYNLKIHCGFFVCFCCCFYFNWENCTKPDPGSKPRIPATRLLKIGFQNAQHFFKKRIGYLAKILAKFLITVQLFFFINFILISVFTSRSTLSLKCVTKLRNLYCSCSPGRRNPFCHLLVSYKAKEDFSPGKFSKFFCFCLFVFYFSFTQVYLTYKIMNYLSIHHGASIYIYIMRGSPASS